MAQQRLGDIHIPQGVDPQGYRQTQGKKALIHRRQDVLVSGVGGGDTQVGALLQLRQRLRLREQLLPALGQRQEFLARRRQRDVPLALTPHEQRRAYPFLQRPYPHGQRGLGDVQRLRRGGHGAVLYHRPECLDIQVGHTTTSEL